VAPRGRTVRDGLDRVVPVPPEILRVVSLAPSVTETLVDLGFADRLVGVSDFCVPPPNHPVRRVGGLLNPDLEVIRTLHPDVLIGTTSGNDPGLASQAEALGLPLYILNTPDVAAVLASVESLAALLGDPDRGARLAGDLRRRLAAVETRVKGRDRPRLLFVVWAEPLVVPGSGAFLTDAIRRAGGRSVTADQAAAHPTFSVESAVALAPEVILTTEENAAFAAAVRTDPAWASVPAVRTGRVAVVGNAVVRPGPGVVGGIEEMARILHPEAAVP
jgi:ABC-type Fe3+-hydroxamate transport system substrate-binding protein